MIDSTRIADARSLLARHFGPTRIARAASLSSPGHDVFLKIETELPTGSFKVRGALYSLSVNAARRPIAEVIAASTGNHGAAVAYAGRQLGVRATIFLPIRPNPVKAARIRELGASLVEVGADLTAAIDAAQDYAERTGAFFLHDASDPDVPIGASTIGREILDARPETAAIYVPVGDTALIRGVAAAARQRRADVRIVGVVAERAPAYYLSWKSGRVVETATADTIADGLAVRRPLASNVAAIGELVDDVRLVSEDELRAAIAFLQRHEHVTAEPAAAASVAALMKENDPTPGTVALLVTGSNIAPDLRV